MQKQTDGQCVPDTSVWTLKDKLSCEHYLYLKPESEFHMQNRLENDQ